MCLSDSATCALGNQTGKPWSVLEDKMDGSFLHPVGNQDESVERGCVEPHGRKPPIDGSLALERPEGGLVAVRNQSNIFKSEASQTSWNHKAHASFEFETVTKNGVFNSTVNQGILLLSAQHNTYFVRLE